MVAVVALVVVVVVVVVGVRGSRMLVIKSPEIYTSRQNTGGGGGTRNLGPFGGHGVFFCFFFF